MSRKSEVTTQDVMEAIKQLGIPSMNDEYIERLGTGNRVTINLDNLTKICDKVRDNLEE